MATHVTCAYCKAVTSSRSFSHSGPEDRNVTWALSVAAVAMDCPFPHPPSPPGLSRTLCLRGHLSHPFLCDPVALDDVNLSPGPAGQHALRAYVYVVGTVPGALMQRWQESHFCARGAQSGEGTDIVTCGYSDGLRTV